MGLPIHRVRGRVPPLRLHQADLVILHGGSVQTACLWQLELVHRPLPLIPGRLGSLVPPGAHALKEGGARDGPGGGW